MTQEEKDFCDKVIMVSVTALASLYVAGCVASIWLKVTGTHP